MSNAQPVTDANWDTEVLKAGKPVLADFWAEWCGPCHMIAPIIDEIAQEKAESLKVVKLNVDENPKVARQYAVMSIPTLLMIVDGIEKRRLVGALPKNRLLDAINEFV
jgi:thioredoxin 1